MTGPRKMNPTSMQSIHLLETRVYSIYRVSKKISPPNIFVLASAKLP